MDDTTAPPAKKKPNPLIGFAAIGVTGLLVFAACSSGSSTTSTDTSNDTPTTSEDTQEPEVEAGYTADTDDWSITLKVIDKQCFGSAGCNVEVKPKVEYVGDATLPDEGTVSITFKVSGDDSGSLIETLDVDLSDDGTYTYSTILMSTNNSSVKPKAKVSEVEYANF